MTAVKKGSHGVDSGNGHLGGMAEANIWWAPFPNSSAALALPQTQDSNTVMASEKETQPGGKGTKIRLQVVT